MSKKVKANLKCIVALLLALTMVLGTLLPVFAETSGTGSLSSDMGDDIKIDSVSGDASGSVSDDGISISEDATVSGSDGIKIDKTDDGDIKIKEIDKKSGDDIVLDSHSYTVEWYDADLNLLKSDVRYGTLGDTVYATDEDKGGFDGLVFDEENGLNKLDCKINVYDSAVIWVMMKEKPKAGPRKAQARYLAYPSADDVHMTHYFITDLSDYGGHRLVKENNTYWRQYNLQMYPMFDWSEVESGKFDYEFKEYTCSDPETIWGLNGTLYSGNLYWGTFYFENRTDRLNATHYFGWQASLESLVSSVPAGYAYHSVYWNAKFKEDSVRPKSGFQVNTEINGVISRTYEGSIVNTNGISVTDSLNTYLNSNWKKELLDKNSMYQYVFSGYKLVSGSGTILDPSSETSTFNPNNSFSVIVAQYEAKDKTRFRINTILNDKKVGEKIAYCNLNEAFTIYNHVNRDSFDTSTKKYKFLKYELVSGDASILSPNSQNSPCVPNSLDSCVINAYFSFDEAITLQIDFKFSGDLDGHHTLAMQNFDNIQQVILNDYITKNSKLFNTFEKYTILSGQAIHNGGEPYDINLHEPFQLQYGSNFITLQIKVDIKDTSKYIYYDYTYVNEAIELAGYNRSILNRLSHYEVYTSSTLSRSTMRFKIATNSIENLPHSKVYYYYFVGSNSNGGRDTITCRPDGSYDSDDPASLYFKNDSHTIVMWPICDIYYPYYIDIATYAVNPLSNETVSSNSVRVPVYYYENRVIDVSEHVDSSFFDNDLFDYSFAHYDVFVQGYRSPEKYNLYTYTDLSESWSMGALGGDGHALISNYSFKPVVGWTPNSGYQDNWTIANRQGPGTIGIYYDAKPKANRITVVTKVSGDEPMVSSKSELFTDLYYRNVGQLIDKNILSNDDDRELVFDGYTLESEDGYLYDLTKEDTDCYCGLIKLGNDIKVTANYHVYSESFKLSYDLTGGEGTFPEQDAVDGNYIVTDVVPKKAEYDFIGWSRTKDSETPEYGAGDFIVADNNITLYAVWQKKAIAIEPDAPILAYDTRGGSTIPGTSAVNDTFTVTRRTPALDGKEFVGWTTDPDSVNPLDVDYVGGDVIPGKERMILYALYKDAKGGSGSGSDNPGGGDDDNPGYPATKTYTLTYDTKTETSIDPQQSNTGSFTVTRRIPVKDGYVFAGWSTSEDPQSSSEIDYFAGDQFPAVQDITLHAVFVSKSDAESYSITYDSKGGSEVKPTKPDAGIFMVTRRVPVKDGYVFAGWSTDEDASGIDYIAGDKISAIENITLYAVYVKKEVADKYLLSYDTQGGSAVSDTEAVDGAFMVSRRTPKKDDKVFIGWSKVANDDDIDYIAGDLVLADQNRVLYAVYADQADKPTGKNYTISYNTRGGSEIPNANSINGMFTVTRRVPELPDKTFAGWTLDPDSDKFVDIDYLGGDSFPAQKDIVLYAIYSDIEVTVNTNGGSDVITNVTQIDNKYIINISITYKAGYILSGWDTDGDGKPDVDPDDPIKTDDPEKPIDAVWDLKITPAQYITTKDSTWETQVTWDEQSDIDEDTVRGIKDALIDENGRAYVQIPDTIPERAGYIFLGWDLDNPLIQQNIEQRSTVEPYALFAQPVARLMCASEVLDEPVIEMDTELNARAGEDDLGYYQADDKLYMDELDPVYESGLKFTAMWKPKDGGSGDGDGDGEDDPKPSVSPDPSPSISPEPSESPEPSGKPDSSITPNPSPSVSDNDPDPSVTPDPNESPSPSPGVSDNDPGRPGVSENKPTGTPIPSGTPGGEKPGDKDPGTNNGGNVTPPPGDIMPNPNKPSVSGNVSGNKTPSNQSKPGTGVSNNNTPSPGNNNSGNNNNTGTGGSGNNNSGNSGSNSSGGSNGSSGGNNNAQNAKSTQDQKSDHVVSAVRTADAEYMMFIIIFSVGAIALGYLICRKTGLLAGRDE